MPNTLPVCRFAVSGSIAGNIFMTRDHADHGGPFPSDVYTILATLGTTVTIGSQEYEEWIKRVCLNRNARGTRPA